jgi:hypothetical protein
MSVTRRNARLVAIVIGTGVAGALASAAAAGSQGGSPSHEQLHVNPSTGFMTPAPADDQTVHVNPSTGYASVPADSISHPVADARAIEPAAAAEPSSGFDWSSAGMGAPPAQA